MYDSHNPYIKEHAVVCLKFLLEGNQANQEIVRQLEARGIAPRQQQQQESTTNSGDTTAGLNSEKDASNDLLDSLGMKAEFDENARVRLVRRTGELGAEAGGADTGQPHVRRLSEKTIGEKLKALTVDAGDGPGSTNGASARVISEDEFEPDGDRGGAIDQEEEEKDTWIDYHVPPENIDPVQRSE